MSLGFVLDTGALTALETPAKQRRLAALFDALGDQGRLVISAGCLAEAWRGGPRQAPLALLVRRPATTVAEITTPVAKAIGVFLGRQADGGDVVDAHVVMLARHHGFAVVTSDSDDLRAIDPKLHLTQV